MQPKPRLTRCLAGLHPSRASQGFAKLKNQDLAKFIDCPRIINDSFGRELPSPVGPLSAYWTCSSREFQPSSRTSKLRTEARTKFYMAIKGLTTGSQKMAKTKSHLPEDLTGHPPQPEIVQQSRRLVVHDVSTWGLVICTTLSLNPLPKSRLKSSAPCCALGPWLQVWQVACS